MPNKNSTSNNDSEKSLFPRKSFGIVLLLIFPIFMIYFFNQSGWSSSIHSNNITFNILLNKYNLIQENKIIDVFISEESKYLGEDGNYSFCIVPKTFKINNDNNKTYYLHISNNMRLYFHEHNKTHLKVEAIRIQRRKGKTYYSLEANSTFINKY